MGLPTPIVWTIVVIAGGIFALHFSTFGREVYAAGGNRVAALYSGIRVDRVKIACLTVVGSLAGLAGVVMSARAHAARRMSAPALNLMQSPP